jgi:Raf kinase inhibitor-like YbhB/YbcL family protein
MTCIRACPGEVFQAMALRINLLATALLILYVAGCSNKTEPLPASAAKIQVTSSVLQEGQPIPDKYTGHGQDVSPPLQWTGAPPQTKSFAIVCDDPDAPDGTFTHWIIYNVPPADTNFTENITKTETLPDGSQQGKNSFGNIGYNGPAPPAGQMHHYHFRLFALDTMLNLSSGVDRDDLLNAMKGHVLAEGELMGTYESQ